mmetsp:Transcript_29928/g.78894  ORF Transcript_29928/g.78894 Transcript_29928/m.78894 type:complete len:821 (+) Transcript_29928:87-2549(+)
MPCDNLPELGGPDICQVDGGGLLLPLLGNAEQEWPNGVRAALYLIGLLWCFLGVALIADVFMGAIEKVTSKRVLIDDKVLGKKRTKTVWNPTVANLTLMALGSSAPEILLNVIGAFPYFTSGELGPSTIVGSAAFNLLCITAVCVVAIPGGQTRKIKDVGVFSITAFFSVFAYIWLLVILMLWTPDVVSTAEGVLTFLFFWVLVVLAFLADTGKLPGTAKPPAGCTVHPANTPAEIADMELKIRAKYGENCNLTSNQVCALMQYEFGGPESRAKHRIHATRTFSGGKRILGRNTPWEEGEKIAKELGTSSETVSNKMTDIGKPKVGFKALNYAVKESIGTVKIGVKISEKPKEEIKVKYSSKDGTAKAGADYTAVSGILEFGPNKPLEQDIEVSIIATAGHEPTEEFYVELLEEGKVGDFLFGRSNRVTIVVVDDDTPGELSFFQEQLEVPSSLSPQTIEAIVMRNRGTSGAISCQYSCEADSAMAGADFEAVEGELQFTDGQKSAMFSVTINAKARERNETFRIYLKEPKGTTFASTTDGGSESCIMTIILLAGKTDGTGMGEWTKHVQINWDQFSAGNANYKEQFISAIYPGGTPDGMKEASAMDWFMHILAVPWKLLFAIVPPADYAGGWVCFFCALAMVGFVTVIIGDMAELLGCVVGMKPAVTAITLVALGTSLPDTFASKTAAVMDEYADNSIGNVTGSNSVNVFLGLGLPWMICAIYWEFAVTCSSGDLWWETYPTIAPDYGTGIFVVKAGSLGVSVMTFCLCAVTCIGTLVARRFFIGGELGGPPALKWATAVFFVILWAVYIVVSILFSDE